MKKKTATLISSTGLAITDIDNTNITSATISITGNYQTDEDILSVLGTLPTGITKGEFDTATGTITLTGNATLANYKTALTQITYNNTNDNPNISTRALSFTVNDGTNNSNTITRTINVAVVYTDLGTSLPSFVESFRKFIVDKLTANLNSIEVTAENNLVKLTYLGDISISDLINKLGIGSTKTSFSLKNPSLTIEGTGQDRTYKVSIPKINLGDFLGIIKDLGKIDLPTDITNKLYSLGDVDLALSNQGLSLSFAKEFNLGLGTIFSFNDAIPFIKTAIDGITNGIFGTPNLTLSQLDLNLFKNNEKKLQLELNGLLNENNVGFSFDGSKTIFDYKLKDKIDFGKWAADIPILNSFKIENPELILSTKAYSLNDPKLGTLKLSKGFNFIGDLNFGDVNTDIGKFIHDSLGIGSLGAHIGIDPAGLISFSGIIPQLTNTSLIPKLGDFTANLNNLSLGLNISKLKSAFNINGNLKLTGYDPTQTGEPELLLSGGLILDAKSLSGYFNLKGEQVWKNPFGLKGTEIRNVGFQVGGTYLTPYFDNFGFIGDFKFGKIDISTAFSVDTNDPDKVALALTINKPISLLTLYTGPINSFLLEQVSNQTDLVGQALDFLDKVFPLTIESIDSDQDGKLDPLVQFVPFATEIAGETLEEGFAINGKVTAWNKSATLAFRSNTSLTNINGSLKVPEIDLTFLKISGVGDKELNLDLKVDSTDKYLKGDGRIEIFGKTIAKVDVEITPTSFKIKDFDLDFAIVALDIDNLSVSIDKNNLAKSKVTGSGKVKFFGKEIAAASIDINSDNLIVRGNLDLFGVLTVNNAEISISRKNTNSISIKGKATIFGQSLDSEISIQDGKLKATGKISLDVGIGTIAANLMITSDGTPGGSKVRVDYNVGKLASGNYEVSLAPLTSVESLLEQAIGASAGKAVELVNDAINTAVKGFGLVSNTVIDTYNKVFEFGKNIAAWSGGVITSIFGGSNGIDEALDDGPNNNYTGDRNDKLWGRGGNDLLNGQRGDDQLYGENGNDSLFGESGKDFLSGGNDNDFLFGGDGNDRLNGDNGNDFLDGGSGDDYLDAWTGNDILKGDDGNDFLTGGNDNDLLFGQGGKDVLHGDDGNDTLYGEDNGEQGKTYDGSYDDDILDGGNGNDYLYGGLGNDLLYGNTGDDVLSGGDGKDYLHGYQGNDILYGNTGDDVLFGQGDNDILYGGDGNDYLYGEDDGKQGSQPYDGSHDNDILDGGAGNDYLYGGVGNDTLYGDTGNDILYGGDGNDYLNGYMGKDILDGNNGDDLLFGQQDNDSLNGGDGNDTLYGEDNGSQNQKYDGSQNNDILKGGNGNDYLYGGVGNDVLYGEEGDDVLSGGDGNDYLNGYKGNDTLDGNNGDDVLFGQQGNDILYGGDGNDYLYGEDDGTQNQTYDGSQDNDTLYGGNGNDYLYGGVGNDVLYGQEGNDFLSGGDGDDLLDGGNGNDYIQGDNGNDGLYGYYGNDTLVGGAGNDKLAGWFGDDKLFGDEGNDTLFGEQANDELIGWFGNDYLDGGDGNDILNGQQDNDSLLGGLGNDVLVGGLGADKFIFNSPNEGTDRIQDFNRLEGDKILISALSFGTGVTLQKFNFNYSTNTLFFNNQQIAILDNVTNSNFSVNQDVTLV